MRKNERKRKQKNKSNLKQTSTHNNYIYMFFICLRFCVGCEMNSKYK